MSAPKDHTITPGPNQRRDGGPARVYATDGEPPWSIHGAIQTEKGWRAATWQADGRYGNEPSDDDLVAPCDKRPPELWAVVKPDGTVFAVHADEETSKKALGYCPDGGRPVPYVPRTPITDRAAALLAALRAYTENDDIGQRLGTPTYIAAKRAIASATGTAS